MKGILWNREIPKLCKTTACEVYFKPILTCNTKTMGCLQREAKTDRRQKY
jgi:hypothetical protein